MNDRDEPNIFNCPNCDQIFQSTLDEIGMEMYCPNCEFEFRIPDESKTFISNRIEEGRGAEHGGEGNSQGISENRSFETHYKIPSLSCLNCEYQFSSEETEGKKEIECPQCETLFELTTGPNFPETTSIHSLREESTQGTSPEESTSQIKEIYSFVCPSCKLTYTADKEFSGLQIECSNCGTGFHIPQGLDSDENVDVLSGEGEAGEDDFHIEEVVQEPETNLNLLSRFDDDELSLIQDAMEIPLESLQNLSSGNYWEYVILAELLSKRLAPLTEMMNGSTGAPVVKKVWGLGGSKFKKFIQRYFDDIFKLWDSLYTLMSKDFNKVLGCGDIHSIFIFSEKLNLLTNDLMEIHQKIYAESIPNDERYIEIHDLTTSWVPHCCESLVELVNALRQNGDRSREYKGIHPQVSLIPPNLHQFAIKARELGIGFHATQEIISKFT